MRINFKNSLMFICLIILNIFILFDYIEEISKMKSNGYHSEAIILFYKHFIYFSLPNLTIIVYSLFLDSKLIKIFVAISFFLNILIRCLNVETTPYSGIILAIITIISCAILMFKLNTNSSYKN